MKKVPWLARLGGFKIKTAWSEYPYWVAINWYLPAMRSEHRTAKPQNIQPQNFEGWFRFAHSIFYKDRIHSFVIRYS